MKRREFTAQEIEQRRQNAVRLGLGRNLKPGYHGPRWTKKQLKLLGVKPDADVALLTGRTENAVRIMRERLKIPRASE